MCQNINPKTKCVVKLPRPLLSFWLSFCGVEGSVCESSLSCHSLQWRFIWFHMQLTSHLHLWSMLDQLVITCWPPIASKTRIQNSHPKLTSKTHPKNGDSWLSCFRLHVQTCIVPSLDSPCIIVPFGRRFRHRLGSSNIIVASTVPSKRNMRKNRGKMKLS